MMMRLSYRSSLAMQRGSVSGCTMKSEVLKVPPSGALPSLLPLTFMMLGRVRLLPQRPPVLDCSTTILPT